MATNWTQSLRERIGRALPAKHLLPDQQPNYVRSVVYLFGGLTIGSLAVIVATGVVLAIFGPQWWHGNDVGHFFNSLHFWSVQAFFFFMVVHLWGMFFMGAWRDGRGRTWVVGGIAFLVSIIAAFTGFLSQSNFDSQWIGASAKDLMNSIGVGGFFNVLNFGQMYSFHIFLLPAGMVALVALHIIMVRLRGVVRPYPVKGETRVAYHKGMTQEQYYQGVKMSSFDLVREVTIGTAVVLVLVLVFAAVFSSPDEKPLTLQSVAQSDPAGFTTVALGELAGTSDIAGYGQPYNTAKGATQALGPVSLQELGGVTIPVDTSKTYVLGPLATVKDAAVQAAVQQYQTASSDQQTTWVTNYTDALGKADGTLDANGSLNLATGEYGPLPTMMGALLDIGRSGALDGLLLTGEGKFYQTDYTKPLLFLNEAALPDKATSLNLAGDNWGMMNETGAYPGQAWLWLYTFWYQVPQEPFTGPNADVAVAVMMGLLTMVFLFVPYIPGLNRIPELVGVHRLIWRQHYRAVNSATKTPATATAPAVV
ncbi:MAG: cytochrome b N-terminal domain-containing protein [Ktedonobacterales bacterium]|nr:cytochrome b N-terminal domain-containing protein [Ktedonobacterales bacterium]